MVKEKLISDHAFSPPFHIHGERLLLSVGSFLAVASLSAARVARALRAALPDSVSFPRCGVEDASAPVAYSYSATRLLCCLVGHHDQSSGDMIVEQADFGLALIPLQAALRLSTASLQIENALMELARGKDLGVAFIPRDGTFPWKRELNDREIIKGPTAARSTTHSGMPPRHCLDPGVFFVGVRKRIRGMSA
ncbi:hypothetical protein EV363DRAFT_1412733, partial [Boletus edulis]